MNIALRIKFRKTINEELKKCSEGLYPNLCQMRTTEMGKNKIYNLVLNIISKDTMSIRSALAQVESSM